MAARAPRLQLTTRRRHARRAIAVAAAVLPVVTGLAVVASATASSGYTYKNTFFNDTAGWIDGCINSIIADTADNKAFIKTTASGSGCFGATASLPSGHLGAKADGYRGGAYCGSTGYVFSGTTTYEFGVGSVLCSNPGGLQNFHTVAHGRIWHDIGYQGTGSVSSPVQSY